MTDYIFPPNARVSAEQLRYIANSVGERSIFTGAVRTTSRAGSRLAFGISTTNASDREDYSNKAALQSLIGQLDGQANRVFFADPGYVMRGNYPTGELLSNNTFSNGTTGFNNGGENGVLSVTDRVMRVTRASVIAANSPQVRQTASVIQYAPYASRAMIMSGRGSQSLFSLVETAPFTDAVQSAGPGFATATIVASTTTLDSVVYDAAATGGLAGDYFEIPYVSLSRCALVDGGVNTLLRSDEFDNAAWTKANCTVGANAIAGPDGLTTADSLIDNGTSATHRFTQAVTVSAAAQDMQHTATVKVGTRNFCKIDMITGTGSAAAFIDLTTGAISSVSAATAFSNARAVAAPLGNGWWRFSLVARKISAETSVTLQINSSDSGATATYSGASNAAIYVARATGSPSGVAARLKQTTTAASTGESQLGNSLHLKGLPASTAGLLLPGDRVQVGRQLNIVIAPLNSDASGLGYLQCANRWRTNSAGIGPVDNDPVIIHQPFGRFVQSSPETGWDQQPGGLSNYDLQIEEALDI